MLTLPLDLLFLFAITTPLIGWLAQKVDLPRLSGVYATLGILLSAFTAFQLLLQTLGGVVPPTPTSGLFNAYFDLDIFGSFAMVIQIGLGIAASIFSIQYMRSESGSSLYYALLIGMIGGMVGVVTAADLFTLFVFWEMMCLTSYLLVAFKNEEPEPVEAGIKYLLMSSAGSATLLFGISLLYGMTGTLNFGGLATALGHATPGPWLYIALLFIFTGFGVKAAIVPLHTWLPDAHSAAPSPISAMLSGIVIETGLLAMVRVLFTALISLQTYWSMVFAVLAVITMTLGNMTALVQDDLKRMLAYSSIGHIGYMLAGLAAGTVVGLTGTILHILNHALMKGTAFLCAGAIIYRLGSRNLADMSGLARRMPKIAVAFSIAIFALIGLPGLNGFVSKLTLFVSVADVNLAWVGIAIILNSAISAGYYLRIVRVMIETESEPSENLREAPVSMWFPIWILAILIITFGIWPDLVFNIAERAALAILSMT
ncbi:NADH-quinone oxidoreductase subunit M [Candidatus Thorarchaeota archaeon]|nr:MAG: NADH-quinone oxidoreductase subunit M [Candidatus Thorarchaeota archaeon]